MELVDTLQRRRVDIACLQEIKWTEKRLEKQVTRVINFWSKNCKKDRTQQLVFVVKQSVIESLPTVYLGLPSGAKHKAGPIWQGRRGCVILWQGDKECRTFNRVRWNSIITKKGGGLGIKNLKMQNRSHTHKKAKQGPLNEMAIEIQW